jgi:hypothetical protein
LNNYLISTLATMIFLHGCGGSSSSTPNPPVVPTEYNFSLTSQLTNKCGVKSVFTDIKLLVQDDTWQTIDTYESDEDGVISFVTTSEFINYTVIAKNQQANENEGLNIVSFYRAHSATASYYHAQFDNKLDNSSCECIKQNLSLSHRPFSEQTHVNSSLPFDSWQALNDSTTIFEGVEVCRASNEQWPLHSFSVKGQDSNQKDIAIAEFFDDFDSNESALWSLSAFQVADNQALTLPHQSFITNQLVGDRQHFVTEVDEMDPSLLIFDTHPYISEAYYQSRATQVFDESSSIFGSSVVKTHQQIIASDAASSFAVMAVTEKPPIDDRNFSEIQADGSYNYSAVTGFPMVIVTFTFTTFDPLTQLLMPAKWTHFGPQQGSLAISGPLTGYEDIVNINTDKKATNVVLINSVMANDYEDYISHFQSESNLAKTIDFNKKLDQVEINIELN